MAISKAGRGATLHQRSRCLLELLLHYGHHIRTKAFFTRYRPAFAKIFFSRLYFLLLFRTIDCLKRIAAIFFLLVLLLNFVGYRLVLTSLQASTSAAIEIKVDAADYNEADLVSVKTALNLPYYSSSPEFERAYGSITINGTDYEYVKRRVFNDTLELRCLPNHDKTRLKTVGNDLAEASANGQPSEKKGSSAIKLTLPDFFQPLPSSTAVPGIFASQTHPLTNTAFLADGYAMGTERPPASKHPRC